jgi:hypothetical protein
MKKAITTVAILALLFAACGREGGKEDTLTQSGASAAPTATAKSGAVASTASPGATDEVTDAPGGATARPAATAAATSGPARTAPPEGRSNPPKDGTYVYAYKGEASDPFNPAAPPQKFSGELNNDISHEGNVYTSETTNSESAGRTTLRTRYSTSKVELLSFKVESQGGDFGCTFNPPLLITKFPIKPETYPKQNYAGEGNACDGSLEVQIIGKETVKDATGKAWSTWKAHVRTTFKSDQLDITQDENRWVSPELGIEIKTIGTTKGKFATTNFDAKNDSVLKSHP